MNVLYGDAALYGGDRRPRGRNLHDYGAVGIVTNVSTSGSSWRYCGSFTGVGFGGSQRNFDSFGGLRDRKQGRRKEGKGRERGGERVCVCVRERECLLIGWSVEPLCAEESFCEWCKYLAYLVAGISGREKTKEWCAGYGGRPAGRRSGIIAWDELWWIRVWEISDGNLVIILNWYAYLITYLHLKGLLNNVLEYEEFLR